YNKEMKMYMFLLGRNPDLSLAELKSVFLRLSLPFKLIQHAGGVALVETIDLPIESINTILGGTVKIGTILEKLPLSAIHDLPDLFITEVLFNEFFAKELKKVEFGVSIYSCGGKHADIIKTTDLHSEITQSIKKELESHGIKSHFPQIRETELSSASVDKNKLLKKGAEILIVVTQDSLLVGKTGAVQEFEAFSKRDFGRPVRDMKSGVMPPKLARMMINIAQVPLKSTLLDPFCGSGTMVQEALVLGYRNIVATDKSEKAIRDTQKNTDWYISKINPEAQSAQVEIKHVDVKKISHVLQPNSVQAIVTEPYLGPTLKKRLTPQQANHSIKELTDLYLSAWKQFHTVLAPRGSVVMILPAFQGHITSYVEILDDIEKMGFTQEQLSGSQRKSVLVGTGRDYVLREIVKFVKR
ncbi:MAG TPA: DNA methyltransferase, partial [Candidatus Levybacteria bacterium]|nr:DNA methyltransferase [Candidatus Levybacteria bacterium]